MIHGNVSTIILFNAFYNISHNSLSFEYFTMPEAKYSEIEQISSRNNTYIILR